MKRLGSFIQPALGLTIALILIPPAGAETVLARGVAANGGGEASGIHYTAVGTLGQTFIGVVSGPLSIHEIGFWYPAPSGASAVEWSEDTLPASFALGPVQPNPSGQTMVIRYAAPRRSHITITLYDVSGRQVRTLVDAQLEPGYHNARLSTDGLSSGIFFCRMTADRFTQTKRLVLLR